MSMPNEQYQESYQQPQGQPFQQQPFQQQPYMPPIIINNSAAASAAAIVGGGGRVRRRQSAMVHLVLFLCTAGLGNVAYAMYVSSWNRKYGL